MTGVSASGACDSFIWHHVSSLGTALSGQLGEVSQDVKQTFVLLRTSCVNSVVEASGAKQLERLPTGRRRVLSMDDYSTGSESDYANR